MAEEVAAGIYRLKLPLPWVVDLMPFSTASINVYLVKHGSRLMLVDSGLNDRECWEKLCEEITHLGFRLSELTDLVATHAHPDHVGLIDALLEEAPGARVHLHPRDLTLIEERHFRPHQALNEFKRWLQGHGLDGKEEIELSAVHLNTGQFSRSPACQLQPGQTGLLDLDGQVWQFIWTPGHTPGHLTLYNPSQKILLAGDHLFANSSPNISKFPGSGVDPLGDYLNSLELLSQFDIKLVLPGHGQEFSDLKSRSRKIFQQCERKLERLMLSLGSDCLTGFELAHRMWDGASVSLDGNSRRLALTETLAFIEWLSKRGKLVGTMGEDGLIHYQVAGR